MTFLAVFPLGFFIYSMRLFSESAFRFLCVHGDCSAVGVYKRNQSLKRATIDKSLLTTGVNAITLRPTIVN